MPFINHPCDYCQRIDLPVYERYTVQTGSIFHFKQQQGRLIPANMSYWCADCAKESDEQS